MMQKDSGQLTKLAIVGFGLIGQRHAEAIEVAPSVELAAIVEPECSASRAAVDPSVAIFADITQMFENFKPDGVIIASPTTLHILHARQCVEAGVPTLIEKPISDDLAAAQELTREASQANVELLVGHHRRFNPINQRAHGLIRSGEIGDVRSINTICWFYKPDYYFNNAPWRKQKGAGPVSVNLVHDIDLMRYLCGEVQSVQAQACRSKRGYENEDVASAVLRFENDVIGTISVSDSIVAPWSWEMTSKEYPIYPRTSQSSYMIGGSEGSLSVPDLTLWSHIAEPDWWSPISATSVPCEQSDPLVNQILNFCGVIRGDEKPRVSLAEGVRTLEVVDAIHRASRTGETIHLSPNMGKTRAAELHAAQL